MQLSGTERFTFHAREKMTNSIDRPTVPPWLHKLFTGHQYPYVRRLAKFAQPIKPGEDRQEPTKDLI